MAQKTSVGGGKKGKGEYAREFTSGGG